MPRSRHVTFVSQKRYFYCMILCTLLLVWAVRPVIRHKPVTIILIYFNSIVIKSIILRYATRAKSIKNHATINEDPKDALLRKFQKEIEELRKQLGEGADYQGEDGDDDSDDGNDDYIDENGKVVRQKKSNWLAPNFLSPFFSLMMSCGCFI